MIKTYICVTCNTIVETERPVITPVNQMLCVECGIKHLKLATQHIVNHIATIEKFSITKFGKL